MLRRAAQRDVPTIAARALAESVGASRPPPDRPLRGRHRGAPRVDLARPRRARRGCSRSRSTATTSATTASSSSGSSRARSPSSPDACAFCAIVSGESDAQIVFEDEISLAFLDNRPALPRPLAADPPRAPRGALGPAPTSWSSRCSPNARLSSQRDPRRDGRRGRVRRDRTTSSARASPTSTSTSSRNRKDGLRGFFWPRRKYESEERGGGGGRGGARGRRPAQAEPAARRSGAARCGCC